MAILKRNKDTKKKGGENTIGKIIYGFLLFMPLIAVGVACLYVILNKNAYQSYEGEIESIDVQNLKQLNENESVTGTNYTYSGANYSYYENTILNRRYYTNKTTSTGINVNNLIFNVDNFYLNGTLLSNIKAISVSYASTNTLFLNTFTIRWTEDTQWQTVYRWGQNGNQYTSTNQNITFGEQEIQFDLIGNRIYKTGDSFALTSLENSKYILTNLTITNKSLDNVFYYQMERLEESDLFNWTKNTATYDVLHNTTTLLGISNTYTPMLLTYWLVISVTYFIFDIALILVWAVHDKIHELKESI